MSRAALAFPERYRPKEKPMPLIDLSAGVVDYDDSGGDGPVVVLLHGLLMDGTLWRHVVAGLEGDYRCIVPVLPFGAHRRPMRPDADLSILGQVRLVAELLDALDLQHVTLVGNDWGGAQLLVSEGLDDRVARLVLVSCEAFDNYPPGVPGRLLCILAKVPGGLAVTAQGMRIGIMRRLPITFGAMSVRPVPAEVIGSWLKPLRRREIRRDVREYLTQVPTRAQLLEWSERQRSFERPVCIIWAEDERMMPPEHARRLGELFKDSEVIEIADSRTLIPEDQPEALVTHLRAFLARTGAPA
jgi:pimeloyl-ACP methyl ester carboxylesterase